jgi:S1-C subfamily serine protease
MVSDVTPGGPADEKLTQNDVITEVLYPLPRRPINSPTDLQSILKGLKNGEYISLSVFNLADRNHAPRIVNIQVGR